ncbi:MAG: type II toxin-antitoxin system prevent-host-death family antitoxin [Raoultibacter sp.]
MNTATIGYSEARLKWSELTKNVMENSISVTVFKNNKPAFKIVPLDNEKPSLLNLADDVTEEYYDMLEKLAK